MERWHTDFAWSGAGPVLADVVIEADDGQIVAVTPGQAHDPRTEAKLSGLTLPGLVNSHSHAFHRALRGRTHGGQGDFWTWREQMYRLAGRLDPDQYFVLATACYTEMALAGITTVGEFHYLHHDPRGLAYDDPNVFADALVSAARTAGIRITLLDTCYLRAGLDGAALSPVQRRYSDGSVDAWVERVERLRHRYGGVSDVMVGVGAHSVRALDRRELAAVAGYAQEHDLAFHIHLSEQPAENDACLAATGMTPTALLAAVGGLTSATTAIHATHLNDDDVKLLGTTTTAVCLCPTTERDLADGIGPAAALRDAGAGLCLGSDSQAVIDLFEEARAVELDERLACGQRGRHRPTELADAATLAGAAALGWPSGGLAPGMPADLVTVRLDSVRLAGADRRDLLPSVVFGATATDVRDVVVGGRAVVRDGHHLGIDDPAGLLESAVAAVWLDE